MITRKRVYAYKYNDDAYVWVQFAGCDVWSSDVYLFLVKLPFTWCSHDCTRISSILPSHKVVTCNRLHYCCCSHKNGTCVWPFSCYKPDPIQILLPSWSQNFRLAKTSNNEGASALIISLFYCAEHRSRYQWDIMKIPSRCAVWLLFFQSWPSCQQPRKLNYHNFQH